MVGILAEGIVDLVACIDLAGMVVDMVVDMAAVDIEVEAREKDAYMLLEEGWVRSFDWDHPRHMLEVEALLRISSTFSVGFV